MNTPPRRLLTDASVIGLGLLEAVATRDWGPGWMFAVALLAATALVLRRRFPRTVLVLSLPGLATSYIWLPTIFALYTVAATPRHRAEPWAWAAVVCGVGFYPWPHLGPLSWAWEDVTLAFLLAAMLALAPLGLGLLSASRRELAAKAAELALSRERERALAAERATTAERARIAREMHDSVAHHLSLIALKGTTGDPARQHAEDALTELRRTVSALRAPGLSALPALVKTAGPQAHLHMDLPDAGQCPLPVQQTVYRVVQEALTNARKHAPGGQVRITLAPGPDTETLHTTVHSGPPTAPATALPSGGHGLNGLRERVTELGGALHSGPEPDGGFRVRAVLPLSITVDGYRPSVQRGYVSD
ncbi:sensor histidine kinase [Streptomyces gobiensis]|uniref:sensor histidine kinase n=1 Tax=Streptomyces gobiensis TaxID=2875706 RepID=UPI001E4DFF58|nr:histidine kinase [Streptomyces gobiensis]UGY92382.1 histidine kinase [Streptomyces gobiensis]